MLKRWKKDRADAGASDAVSEPVDEEHDALDDLMARLDAVTAAPDSAATLRDAFRPRVEEPVVVEAPTAPRFTDQFSADSLFFTSTDDPTLYETVDEAEPESAATLTSAYYDPSDPWAVLGISPTDDWATVVAAHRKLAVQFHPDRLHHLPAEEQAASENRMREINIAYTTLRRIHQHHD